ncbi:hypothetical protein [Paenibacillus ehimensis]|uniref:hypothetical protein n=1 Tax=Paenibacillus ehimensis TaxID=79264 RepID=UPI00158004D9|nr:hypothetical protein [Paenibacillus ehimensis]
MGMELAARQPATNATKKMGSRVIRTWHRTKYLWLLFLPCLIYFLVFRYAPMFGLIITFQNYNVFKGIWASECRVSLKLRKTKPRSWTLFDVTRRYKNP